MKKCFCSGSASDIIKWETPGHKILHICTVCGHTTWPDTGRSDAEEQASSSTGDDNTAL